MEVMEEAGLLGECKRWPVHVRTDPITDNYAVEARPFARGKFASVRRCRHLVSGVEFAAKYMRKRRRAQDVRHEIMHEARVLKLSSQHPRVVRMHEVYETPSEIVLVLELVPGGELQRVLDDEEAVEEAAAARLLKQILDGVAFLHQHRIAHLDIKPQNLLLTAPFPDGEVKLCDFGISRLISKGIEIREIVGTPDYVAPEVLHYEPISLPTDMWSLGVLTYVLLSGHSPFGGETKQETFCNITRGALDFPQDLFSGVSARATHFIKGLLQRDPRERMTAEECLSHPWLNPGSSPLPGICLTLSPEGASDSSPSSVRRRSLERNVSSESPSPKTTRTEEDQNSRLFCKSPPGDHHEACPSVAQDMSPSRGVVHHKSPTLQRNGTCKTEEDKKLFCKNTPGDNIDPSHEPSPGVTESPLLQCNGISDHSGRVFCKTTRPEEDKRLVCNSTSGGDNETSPGVAQNVHKSPLLQHNGIGGCSVGKTTKTEEVNRLFCKSAPSDQKEPSHEPTLDVTQNEHHKSPLLQRNGTSVCNKVAFFCKTTRIEESTNIEKGTRFSYKSASGNERDALQEPSSNLYRKSPSPQRNGTTSDCSAGAFCKLGDTVSQSAFCQSRHTEVKATSFSSKNVSSGVDQGSGALRKSTETTESKGRSVDMVVSQFEGMSKRIVFSEEIIVDERVGMVY